MISKSEPYSPAKPPLSIYAGKVMHARLRPFTHRFTYKVLSLLVDLDRVAEAHNTSVIFSTNRWNIISFYEKDFGCKGNLPRNENEDLAQYARRLLKDAGVADTEQLRVELLCYPRIFGHVFNPIAVYYASDAQGELKGVIYEVRNTFKQMHTYVHPVKPEQINKAGIRHDQEKHFHVSPFLPMDMHYRFLVKAPDERLRLRITETRDREPTLIATFSAQRSRANTANFIKKLFSMSMFAFKIVLAIHFEALRLWIKGARYHRVPKGD